MKYFFVIYILIIIHTANSFGQTPGSNIFNYNGIHDIHITFAQQNYWDSLLIYKEQGDITGDYTYMVATVDFDGQIVDSTGVRFKGSSSFEGSGNKKPFKLKFNEYISGQKLDGLKKINLNNNFNDPTLMREKLFLDVLMDIGVHAPRCVYAKVYLNNTYWGLYTIVDQIDKVFLLSNFDDKSGNLFKGDTRTGMPCANLAYHPDPMEYRNCYTLKTNENINDWSDLENLIDVINNSPIPNYYNTLNIVLNTSSFINAWAANIVFVNVDSYVETGHNYYIYHNPVTDKFEWITWDVNEAFGLWNIGMPLEQLYNLDIFYLPPNPEFERPLSYFMLQDSTFRKIYTDKVYDLVCSKFKPSYFYPKIDSLYNLIKQDVYADTNKIISNQDFEDNIDNDVYIPGYPGWVPGLKKFIEQRADTLISQLNAIGYNFPCITGSAEIIDNNNIFIFPNPTNNYINLKVRNESNENIFIEIINVNGQVLLSKKINNSLGQINISGYSKGVYFIKIDFENYIKIEKIIKF